MEDFHLDSTAKTPLVNFKGNNGLLVISGRSIPENSIDFYKPLLDWLEAYINAPAKDTTLQIKLEYFNTSSSKCLVEVFRRLEKLSKTGKNVEVQWYYDEEDEDMQESGEDFREIVKLPMKMIVNKEEIQ